MTVVVPDREPGSTRSAALFAQLATNPALHAAPSVLPPGLRGWEQALGVLADDVVLGLGPLLRALNEAMADGVDASHPLGEPDGFDGLSSRGDVSRLLISEWMLADEVPDEFLRRYAMSEMQYLNPAKRSPHPTGRVVVLVDAGPDQLGTPRLAQLAALLVLCRRAEASGTEVQLGVLTDEPDQWTHGNPARLVRAWLSARTTTTTTPATIEKRIAQLLRDDHVWLMSNCALPASTARPLHRLSAREIEWDTERSMQLEITIDRRVLRVDVPPPPLALRILRGNGFQTRIPHTATAVDRNTQPLTSLRYPMFPGSARRLLFRGDSANRLVSVTIPSVEHRSYPPVGYACPGRVIGLYNDPNRTVALYETNGIVSVRVFGKSLANLASLSVPIERLGLNEADADLLCEGPPAPMVFQSGDLIVALKGRYLRIGPSRISDIANLRYMLPWRLADQPLLLQQSGESVFAAQLNNAIPLPDDSISVPEDTIPLPGNDAIFTAGNHTVGVRHGPTSWTLYATAKAPRLGARAVPEPMGEAEVYDGAAVRGIVRDPYDPWLVTLSEGGHIIRLCGLRTSKVLTQFSGDILDVVVHPIAPLLAVQYRDGRVVVVDAESQKELVAIGDHTAIEAQLGEER